MSFEELKNYYMSDENKEILKSEYLNSTPLSKGAEKIVSINGPKVFLKYYDLDPASSIAVEQFKNSFSSQLESNYQMLKNGINVVPIFGYFKHDGCYVEVQEKAPRRCFTFNKHLFCSY